MSIRVSVLGSGSRGFIRTDKVRLLIDCGLGPRTLANRLRTIGEDPDQMSFLSSSLPDVGSIQCPLCQHD